MNQITTHVLDTSTGNPAKGLSITLQQALPGGSWKNIASGITNADGRIPDLLKEGETIPPGIYRLVFQTGAYHQSLGVKGFYPEVNIIFETTDTAHYHVPLLLNPFGYSTYRGS